MKKLLYPIVFTLTTFLILYSCSADEEDTTPPPQVQQPTPEPEPQAPTQYTLTVTTGEGGTVSTEGGTYDEGTEVTITALPDEGFQFVGWTGNSSNESSLTITVNSNITLEPIFEINDFVSTAENYSQINQTTRYFSLVKTFKRYISLQEAIYLKNVTGHMFSNFDAVTYDIDKDGKLDLFWFGMSDNIWGLNGGSHSNGKYFIISNYFGQSAPYEIIEYNSMVEFAAGGVYAQDLNGDNQEEILIFSNNVHQINTFGGGTFITDTSNPPDELGTVILKIDNSFSLISEEVVGTAKAIHRGSSGDIDNDGDIDILNFPTGHPVNQTTEQKFPTILYNDGSGNFTEELIFKNTNLEDYYWSLDAIVSHFFDLDNDGNLDLIFGSDIGNNPGNPPIIDGINWLITENTNILWGDGSGKFSWEDRSIIPLNNELNCNQHILGMGFSDYDSDGDIDIVVLTTKEYSGYVVNLFKNQGNRSYQDVTVNDIEGYYHFEGEHTRDLGEMMSIDKDGDGDFDLVPKEVPDFCCTSGDYNFVSDLYWENVGGRYVRRINN
ncbi:VCBS repeat-containing protein [Flavobacteriaceae bacterium]|nr:VCBS repeat-containing protein [Flavobacteriaceae bacterium]MDC1056876.1 VCBS repeat-containing protein [Flavobacteriaceae bacterium]